MESVVISIELGPPRREILKARLIVRERKLKPVAIRQRGKPLQSRLGLAEGGKPE